MKLENWYLTNGSSDPYKAPELIKFYICGKVYGHPTRKDGHPIKTSHIKKLDNENKTITTASGSIYEIGKVDPLYEEAFPDAKKRLFEKKT